MNRVYVTMLQNNLPILIVSKEKSIVCFSNDGKQQSFFTSGIDYIDDLCVKNGSSYTGRSEAFCKVLDVKQKPCILISERMQDMYMPLYSPHNKDCIWVSYNDILDVRKIDDQNTKVFFISGFTYDLPCNYRILVNQMQRCKQFLAYINA